MAKNMRSGGPVCRSPQFALIRPGAIITIAVGCLLVGWPGRFHLAAAEPPWTCRATFGRPGTGRGEFMHPSALDFSPDGRRLAICDTGNHRVVILAVASAGFRVEQILGGPEPSQGRIRHPEGITMDRFNRPQGVVWRDPSTIIVADTDNHRLVSIRVSDGEIAWVLGREGWKDGYFHHPLGLAIDRAGNLMVCEPRSLYLRGLALDVGQRQRVQGNRIQIFDPEMKPRGRLAGHFHRMSGRDQRQLKDPARLFVDPDGDIWVADRSNHRVLRFGPDHQWKLQLQRWPELALHVPEGVHGDGRLVAIADTGNHRVVLCEPAGNVVGVVGRHGVRPGEFSGPRDLRFGPDGRLYVLDTMNCRMAVLAPVGARRLPVSLPLPGDPATAGAGAGSASAVRAGADASGSGVASGPGSSGLAGVRPALGEVIVPPDPDPLAGLGILDGLPAAGKGSGSGGATGSGSGSASGSGSGDPFEVPWGIE